MKKFAIDALKKQIYNPDEDTKKRSGFSFSVTNAALLKFIPNYSSFDKIFTFKDIIFNQSLTAIEVADLNLYKELSIINNSKIEDFNKFKDQPLIFATFHLGSYRAINQYLLSLGMKLVLIIDDNVFKTQGQGFEKLASQLKKQSIKNGDFQILNVKDTRTIFHLKDMMSKGYSLVVYLDGNTGLHEKQNFSKGFEKINFLQSEIHVKNGIQFIAKLTKSLFIPVISYRNDNKIYLEFFDHINFNQENINFSAIKIAYKHLENKLLLYPQQWECWLYMYKWFNRDEKTPYVVIDNLKFISNFERYIAFVLGETKCLFDYYNFESIEIDDAIYHAFLENDFTAVDKDFKEELISKNIII